MKPFRPKVREWDPSGLSDSEVLDSLNTDSVHSLSKPSRAICSTKLPDIVVGWGSIEHPELQDMLDMPTGMETYALHVSTEKRGEAWALDALASTMMFIMLFFLETWEVANFNV